MTCKNINGIFACACLKLKDTFIKIYGFQKDIIKLVLGTESKSFLEVVLGMEVQ